MRPLKGDWFDCTGVAARWTRFAGKLLSRGLSVFLLLVVWQAGVQIFEPALLPAPSAVAQLIWQYTLAGDLLLHLGITLRRVALSFAIAMLLGMVVGLLMGHYRRVDKFLDGLVTLALNLPALVVIILCFIWLGLNDVAAVVAVVINKVPNIAVTFREGAKNIDRDLLAVAKAYRVPFMRTLRQVYLPQLLPYFLAAARCGLALVWKIVLVVELLGCSEGVGFQLGNYFQLFDIASILAYTFAFVAVVYSVEVFVLQPWERSVSRWRTC